MAFRSFVAVLLIAPILGCANLTYYAQAFSGQLEVFASAQPIKELLDSPATTPELRNNLTAALKIRNYATAELGLPDNGSYRIYADLKRPYVLWNVFATPELSLKPKEWCFIIAGCVSYRGYFTRERAEAFAATLRAQGYDVHVAGVTAYSTLGWFDDPIFNTILDRPRVDMAGLIFHELAHQRIYIRDDTAFNESFAMTVEIEGVRRWLKDKDADREFAAYQARLQRRHDFVALTLKHRERLVALYESNLVATEKRVAKNAIFADLRKDYEILKIRWHGFSGYDGWFSQELNNAHIASIGTYHSHVAAFQVLLGRHQGDLAAFYREAEALGRMPHGARAAALKHLVPGESQKAQAAEPML